jgi:ABC-type sulfate transport system permease subunit
MNMNEVLFQFPSFSVLIIIGLLISEYWKREKKHKAIIENLKQNNFPQSKENQATITETIVLILITIPVVVLLLIATFYLIKKFQFKSFVLLFILGLIIPYGLGGTLVLLVRRNILILMKKNDKKENNR